MASPSGVRMNPPSSTESTGKGLFRRKSVPALQREAETDHSLKRALGALNLTMLGIGAIIGTGIFVLTGTVAARNAGPAVVLSFVLAGVASIFAALCYAEFACARSHGRQRLYLRLRHPRRVSSRGSSDGT